MDSYKTQILVQKPNTSQLHHDSMVKRQELDQQFNQVFKVKEPTYRMLDRKKVNEFFQVCFEDKKQSPRTMKNISNNNFTSRKSIQQNFDKATFKQALKERSSSLQELIGTRNKNKQANMFKMKNMNQIDEKIIDTLSNDVLVKNIKQISQRLSTYKKARGLINQLNEVDHYNIENFSSFRKMSSPKIISYIQSKTNLPQLLTNNSTTLNQNSLTLNAGTGTTGHSYLQTSMGYLSHRSFYPSEEFQRSVDNRQPIAQKVNGYVNFGQFVSREKTSYLAQVGTELEQQANRKKEKKDVMKIRNFMQNYQNEQASLTAYQSPGSYTSRQQIQNMAASTAVPNAANIPILSSGQALSQQVKIEQLSNQLRDKIFDVKRTKRNSGLNKKKSSKAQIQGDQYEFDIQSEQINLKDQVVDQSLGLSRQLTHLKSKCFKINI
ncbi:UNKNOWN [Stylonychia lemnae]|uniref:Uncharacterized protein n=1 Tax=Stylonychia lemnae TaxID=5949 RepID=A0A078B0K9_STYLE|nr:UNKNOWN [Stylonychia lemnae]|eukprot:CDW88069.1 UNKNOWN [Stylonychia lemnae]